MKCLSLWQPWASLLAHGQKKVETRGWPMRHRGPLLVHAAKKWDPDLAEQSAERLFFRPALKAIGIELVADLAACRRGWGLPFGAIVGRVDVVDCFRTEDVRYGLSDVNINSGPTWRCLDIGMRERAFGDYSKGRFAILCANPVAFAKPIPYRGAQGLFDVPDAVLSEVG